MRNTIQILLWISISLGLSFVILSSYNDRNDLSVVQQPAQNETQNQMQSDISQLKFLKNSTSFGNATADLKIKHPRVFDSYHSTMANGRT
jgi:hypothetical protein